MSKLNQGIRKTRLQEAQDAWKQLSKQERAHIRTLTESDTLVLSHLKKQVKEHEALIQYARDTGRKHREKRKDMKAVIRVSKRTRLYWLIRYEKAKQRRKHI